MRRTNELVIVASLWVALGAGLVQAEQEKKPAMGTADSTQKAMMAAMEKYGTPGEAHKMLEPLAGNWTYTMTMWITPDAPPETMSGTSTHMLVYGGRFLKQESQGEMEGQPFEGLGYTGYDNMRKEYQTVWLSNMGTGIYLGTGQFDPGTKALTVEGDFACPVTGETHRKFRDVWKIIDANHNVYESYSRTLEGKEFKMMELHYTRAQ